MIIDSKRRNRKLDKQNDEIRRFMLFSSSLLPNLYTHTVCNVSRILAYSSAVWLRISAFIHFYLTNPKKRSVPGHAHNPVARQLIISICTNALYNTPKRLPGLIVSHKRHFRKFIAFELSTAAILCQIFMLILSMIICHFRSADNDSLVVRIASRWPYRYVPHISCEICKLPVPKC